MLLEDDQMADPRYSIPDGQADERMDAARDVRGTVEGIYQMLKQILSKLDQNMPYITRACDRDGGK